jgi:transposase
MVKGEEILRMTSRDFQRLHVVQKFLEQRIKQKDGSELLGVSDRQFRRLVRRVREEGSAGIIHRSRGRPSNRRTAEKTRQKALRLYERKYGDFGPTLSSEKLRELDGIKVNAETLRLWLRQSGVRYKRRKSRCRRQRRERRPCLGAMVQLDGSQYGWKGGVRRWVSNDQSDPQAAGVLVREQGTFFWEPTCLGIAVWCCSE